MVFPIDAVIAVPGTPLRITDEQGHWAKVESASGHEGWVFRHYLSGRRTVVALREGVRMLRDAAGASRAIARIEAGAILSLRECRAQRCLLKAQGMEGWVDRDALWGVE